MLAQRRTEDAKSPSLIVFNRLEEAREAWRTLYDASPTKIMIM